MTELPSDHFHHEPPNDPKEKAETPSGVLLDEYGNPFPETRNHGDSKNTGQEILDRVKMGERWMIVLTAVVAVATLGQGGLAWYNGRGTTDQTNPLIAAANRNADSADSFAKSAKAINEGIGQSVQKLDTQAQEVKKAAASAAKTADASLQVSERAYVVADLREEGLGQCAHVNKGQFFCEDIHYHNIGRTPAILIVATGNLAFGFRGLHPLADLPMPAYDGLTGSTLANGPDGIASLDAKQSMADLVGDYSQMQNANGGFYLFGYIQHKDIFDKTHITAFCNYHPLDSHSTDHLPSQCSTGNWFEQDPALLKANPIPGS
jgi:hypothetical protein